MTRRSRARELALQLLYQRDLNPRVDRPAIERFVRERLLGPEKVPNGSDLEPFILSLYDGVLSRQGEIDSRLTAAAENWRLPRMSAVDRNVLRLGAYELMYTPETPPRVVLDEAIELARRFGSLDSPSFVNGVLDRVLRMVNPGAMSKEDKPGESGIRDQGSVVTDP
jgi:N utilization substance protein B